MIYEISTIQIPAALQNSCSVIIISADSSRALIQGNNIENINVIKEYKSEQLNLLLSDIFWQQPCTNCEG